MKKINIPDFMVDATNVYRTKHYIIKQDLYVSNTPDSQDVLFSSDTFYKRTKQLDKLYEMIFSDRSNVDGRRIKCTSHSRKYID